MNLKNEKSRDLIMGSISYGSGGGWYGNWNNTPGLPFSDSPDLMINTSDIKDCATTTTLSGPPSQSFDTQCLIDATYYEDSNCDDGWTGDDDGSAGTSWSGESDDPGSC